MVMVNIHCELDLIYDFLGDTFLGISVSAPREAHLRGKRPTEEVCITFQLVARMEGRDFSGSFCLFHDFWSTCIHFFVPLSLPSGDIKSSFSERAIQTQYQRLTQLVTSQFSASDCNC